MPVPDDYREEEVKAIIIRKPRADLSAQTVEAHSREGLAAFKVPRYIEFRDELPHTSSGKVAKSVLRAEQNPLNDRVIDLRPPVSRVGTGTTARPAPRG